MARATTKSVPSRVETFGPRLRRLRLEKGLTQLELGRRVGLSNRMVAYYEIEGGEPRPDLLSKFAETLGVSLDVLAGRHKAPKISGSHQEHPRLWRRLKRIEELPLHDRKTILKMIETMADARRKA